MQNTYGDFENLSPKEMGELDDSAEIVVVGSIHDTLNNFKRILANKEIGDIERLILTFAFFKEPGFKFWSHTIDGFLNCGVNTRRRAMNNLKRLGYAIRVYEREDRRIVRSYWRISLKSASEEKTTKFSETLNSLTSQKSAGVVSIYKDILNTKTDENISGTFSEVHKINVSEESEQKQVVSEDTGIVFNEVSKKSDKFETNKAHVVDSKKRPKHEPTVPLSLPVKPVDERSDGGVCKTTQNFDSGYLQVAIGNIPPQLKGWKQWVFWRGVKHDESDKKPTKIPFNATGAAKSNDRTTWMPFVAMQTWMQRKMDGIAFVLSDDDPFSMIDIDGCVENETVSDFARKVIDYFDSYTELSPSGTGVRIFVEGKIDAAIKHPRVNDKTLPLEIYSRSRVATVTGHVIRNRPVCNRQDKLAKTYETYKPKPKLLSATNGKHEGNGVFKMPNEPIPEGQRNNSLAKWAGVMKSKGLPEVEYFAYLHQINLTLCQPPLSDKEVDAIGRSLLRYA